MTDDGVELRVIVFEVLWGMCPVSVRLHGCGDAKAMCVNRAPGV